jgi:nitrilase
MSAAKSVPRLAAVQMNTGADVAANLKEAERLLVDAQRRGAKVAVLPENFAFMGEKEPDKLAVAESDGRGPIQAFLGATAKRLKLWIVGGTLPLKAPDREAPGASAGDNKIFSTTPVNDRVLAACLVFDASGTRVARYDKMHLFDVEVPGAGRYRESATFLHGAETVAVVESPAGKIGLSVCYDLRFPELYRRLTAAGAEILAVPSAFTARTGEAHWEVLLRARAIENQCYVVAPGQNGVHPGNRRTWGHSCIIDPWGTVLALQEAGEGVAVADAPLEALRELRKTFPVLSHRRLNP